MPENPKDSPDLNDRRTGQTILSALNEQQGIFAAIVEYSPMGKVMVDENGKIVLANREIERLFGYQREELLGQPVEILLPEKLRHHHVQYRESYVKDPSPRMMGAGRDLCGRKKDGSEVLIEVGLNPLRIGNQNYVLAAITDVSIRKELEKRTVASEHLAAIGKISSHMAHEIRNPLSSISLNLDLIHDELQALRAPENEKNLTEADSLLQAIKKETDRLTDLASEYLKFSRMSKLQKEKTGFHDFFSGIIYLLEAEARSKGISIKYSRTDEEAYFDPRQMQQVFLNLIRNAMDAMPRGGVISIDVKKEGRNLLILVRDQGAGMDEETQKRLFDPFYTTKEKGTGLGLSLVRQIITENHGGKIWFKSQPGDGTAFFIELPVEMKDPHDRSH